LQHQTEWLSATVLRKWCGHRVQALGSPAMKWSASCTCPGNSPICKSLMTS